VAYLKLITNHKDEIAWKRVLRLYEGVGEKQANALWQEIQPCDSLAAVLEKSMPIKSVKAKGSWFHIIDMYRSLLTLTSQRGFIANAITLIMERYYEMYVKNSFDDYNDRLEDLHQFINFTAAYETLEDLLADIMLSEQFTRKGDAEQSDAVILSTIHQAKGLEWGYVMVLGLRDGDFPHHKSFEQPAQLEEERRLFYVAVTRAKHELSLLFPVRKFSYQYGDATAGPSLFIRELDPSRYVEIRSGGSIAFDSDADPEYEDEAISVDELNF
jgi:DNA helicase-2/ATP-dependent DNA helicase PcrA